MWLFPWPPSHIILCLHYHSILRIIFTTPYVLPSQFKSVLHSNFPIEDIGHATFLFQFFSGFLLWKGRQWRSTLDIRFFILCMNLLSHINWLSQIEVILGSSKPNNCYCMPAHLYICIIALYGFIHSYFELLSFARHGIGFGNTMVSCIDLSLPFGNFSLMWKIDYQIITQFFNCEWWLVLWMKNIGCCISM